MDQILCIQQREETMPQESVHEYAPAKQVETQADKIGYHRDCLTEFAKNANPKEAEALFNLIWSLAFDMSFSRNLSAMTKRFADGVSYTALSARRSAACDAAQQGQELF